MGTGRASGLSTSCSISIAGTRICAPSFAGWKTGSSRRCALLPSKASRAQIRIGVWVSRPEKARGKGGEIAEDMIAAIGIRVRRWVSFHGISLNITPDLTHYSGIVPCGISAAHFGVTSLRDLGLKVGMSEVDLALAREFEPIFGQVLPSP